MTPPTAHPLTLSLGAEVKGIDLSKPIDGTAADFLHRAFAEFKVLAIRGQRLTPDDQIAFARHFGDLAVHGNAQFALPEHEQILILSNDRKDGRPIGVIDAGDAWHSDFSYRETPSRATILYARRIPEHGGDTEFADMVAAYDALPASTRERIEDLRGVHTINKLRNPRIEISPDRENAEEYYRARGAESPDQTHPLVRVHPVTGRKALYLSPRFTIGIADMADEEAQPLLDDLFAHQIKPEFVYRHRWRVGDVVMWDNRCTIHRASGGHRYPDIRTIHRITVLGEAPI